MVKGWPLGASLRLPFSFQEVGVRESLHAPEGQQLIASGASRWVGDMAKRRSPERGDRAPGRPAKTPARPASPSVGRPRANRGRPSGASGDGMTRVSQGLAPWLLTAAPPGRKTAPGTRARNGQWPSAFFLSPCQEQPGLCPTASYVPTSLL